MDTEKVNLSEHLVEITVSFLSALSLYTMCPEHNVEILKIWRL